MLNYLLCGNFRFFCGIQFMNSLCSAVEAGSVEGLPLEGLHM